MKPSIGNKVVFKFAESSASPKMIEHICEVVGVLSEDDNPELDLIAHRPDGTTYTCERIPYGKSRGTWSEIA